MTGVWKCVGIFAAGIFSGAALLKTLEREPGNVPGRFGLTRRDAEKPFDFDVEKFLEMGDPGPIHDKLVRHGYMSVYDRRTRTPAYTAETITKESLAQRDGNRKYSRFKEDEEVPQMYRAKLSDYYRSGYDRGHQVPAADCKTSQTAMDETFLLTNMCPQVGDGFNRNYWAYFEDWCRKLTNKFDEVTIITGPLFLPKKNGDGKWVVSYEMVGNPPSVAVPTHFYKVVIGTSKYSRTDNAAVGAFVLPNAVIDDNTALSTFKVPVEVIERSSGLELLHGLNASTKKDICSQVNCSLDVAAFKEHIDAKKRAAATAAADAKK
ncbi:endodeoxyribonuclease Pnu1 [Schizosaccharomyces japonicus yFS275]|uniref:Endonuclease n=1 Tax=Schizosaccharomyces japonicus (strain yFS275 / FY16936) TaxID=402676 RepID=B6JZB9_SCHJY|nr:endodeoxyribonuclease Pnu1 [Schizosaccharomyces japonicus yFS275]EEB06887.1 endodeoxyribonuclease Pnu1 [Schizosaccharomyces japonicus yFS275]